ncbi:MAG: sigma-70 family RNA polymerase sigma factor [Anaerolineae bacterium]
MFERDPPDRELVARFKGGDTEALDQLFERYHQDLYDFLYQLVGDKAEAERLLEAVFIRVARSLPKLPPDRAFKPWLYNLAMDEALSLLRRRGWLQALPETEFAGEAPRPEAGQVQAEVWRVARRLPAEQRAALALEEQHGFDARGIAVVLGRPEAQVANLLGEARARFGREYDARAEARGLPRSGEVDAALALEMRSRTGRSKSLYGFLPPLILPAAAKNAIKAKISEATKVGLLESLKSACGCKTLAIVSSVMGAAVAVTAAAILFIPCVLQGTPPAECLRTRTPVPPPTVVTEVPPTETPYVQRCAPGVIFCEDFEDGRADGWELGSGWRVERESPNYVLSGRGHDWATLLGQEWEDVRVRFRLKLLEGAIHLNVRLGEGGRYFVGFHEGGLGLIKQVGDTFTELAGVEAWHALGRWHEVEIVGWGGHLQVHVDGDLELDHTDASPLRRGTIAFETLEDSHAQVDDIEVLDAGPEPKPPTPTPVRPTATPRPPTPVPPTEPPPCENDSQFVADVTVPDNTEFDPGTPFEKIWRLRNSGTCPWEAGYELAFVGGEPMSGPDSVPLPWAEPGEEVDIGVVLVAPEEPGTYRGDWRLRAPDGELFGTGFYVQIVVPAPTVTPPEVSFWADDDCVMPGGCTVLRWEVEHVEAVYLDGEGVIGHDAREVCPDRTTTYTLRAVSPAGDIERSVTIWVPEVSFWVDRDTIKQGECTTLRWGVEYVRAVYLDGEGVAGHDSRQVCPSQTTTYTLHVVTDCGDIDRSVTIVVPTPAPDTTPPPVPKPLGPGTPDFSTASSVDCPVTLRWNPVSDPSGVVYHVILEVLDSTWQQEGSWYPVPNPQQQVFGSHCQMGFYYRWHVRAQDGAGNWSSWSDWLYYGVPIP